VIHSNFPRGLEGAQPSGLGLSDSLSDAVGTLGLLTLDLGLLIFLDK